MSPIDRRAIRFPPDSHVWVPRANRRAAAIGLAMHAPCRPTKVLLQRAFYVGVRALGTWVLPGERVEWEAPMPRDEWSALLDEWSSHIPGFDAVGLYMRPQSARSGFAVRLIREGKSVAFARVVSDGARIAREHRVITALSERTPTSFRVAAPIAMGSNWLLTESTPDYPMRPLREASQIAAVAEEISALLTDAIPRATGEPAEWFAAHRDFAPWNVRVARKDVWVFDWEDAGYAPAGADALFGSMTSHITFGSPLPTAAPAAAVEWTSQLIEGRIGSGMDTRENVTLLEALQTVRPV